MDRAKALRIMVLGFALFAVYLGFANLFVFFNIASLPLGTAINDFLLPLVAFDVTILTLFVVYSQRRSWRLDTQRWNDKCSLKLPTPSTSGLGYLV